MYFSAAHHLLNYEGECEHQHGHNWLVEAYVKGENLDKSNILVDYKVLKREMKAVLDNLKVAKALVVVDEAAANAILSTNNLKEARGVYSNSISVYDILKYDTVVVTKSAVKAIEEVYA